jgi:hypothetical protein
MGEAADNIEWLLVPSNVSTVNSSAMFNTIPRLILVITGLSRLQVFRSDLSDGLNTMEISHTAYG